MDRTPYQQNIIKRYYENMPEIMRQKLNELTTELYLADSPKKRAQLWKRVEQALKNLKIPQERIDYLVQKDDPAILAQFIEGKLGNF